MEFAKIVAKVIIINAAAVIGAVGGMVAVGAAFNHFNEKTTPDKNKDN